MSFTKEKNQHSVEKAFKQESHIFLYETIYVNMFVCLNSVYINVSPSQAKPNNAWR